MALLRYIKSFSKGQVTIPKEFRDALGLGEDFWLKLTIKNGTLIAKPTIDRKAKKVNKKRQKYIEVLLTMNTDWFTEKDVAEIKKNRRDIEKRLAKNII